VLLWSKNPWRDIDTLGSAELPLGRFVRAVIRPVSFIDLRPWA
jgi:hypothetical protein